MNSGFVKYYTRWYFTRIFSPSLLNTSKTSCILGDPGADSGGEGKSKRARKYGTKKSKERREEPLGTMSYQTSSKRSQPFCPLIGHKNTNVFWHQSEVRTAVTVWNWSGETMSPGALLAVLYFSSCHIIFFRPFRLSLAPTICPWVSEDDLLQAFLTRDLKSYPCEEKPATFYNSTLLHQNSCWFHWDLPRPLLPGYGRRLQDTPSYL